MYEASLAQRQNRKLTQITNNKDAFPYPNTYSNQEITPSHYSLEQRMPQSVFPKPRANEAVALHYPVFSFLKIAGLLQMLLFGFLSSVDKMVIRQPGSGGAKTICGKVLTLDVCL